MKILLYGVNFAPEPTGIGKYTGEMAAWLAAAGHEVRVVRAPTGRRPSQVHARGATACRYADFRIHAERVLTRFAREGRTLARKPAPPVAA